MPITEPSNPSTATRAEFEEEGLIRTNPSSTGNPAISRTYVARSKIDARSGRALKQASYSQGQRRIEFARPRTRTRLSSTSRRVKTQNIWQSLLSRIYISQGVGHHRRRQKKKEILDRWISVQTRRTALFCHHGRSSQKFRLHFRLVRGCGTSDCCGVSRARNQERAGRRRVTACNVPCCYLRATCIEVSRLQTTHR